MEIVERAATGSHVSVGEYRPQIVLGYVAFAIVALVAVYLASGGPGLSESAMAFATVFP
jgi:hypothetical protein